MAKDTKFKPGQSGNPNGRPKGAKNKMTERARTLLYNSAEQITAKCIEMALAGDIQAIKIAMERIIPARMGLDFRPDMEDLSDGEIIIKFVSADGDQRTREV